MELFHAESAHPGRRAVVAAAVLFAITSLALSLGRGQHRPVRHKRHTWSYVEHCRQSQPPRVYVTW